MKKDKNWLRDELMRFRESTSGRYEDVIGVSHVLRVIDQLDEPAKVVVPQFVADALDYNKNPYWEVDEARIIAHILRCAFGNEAKPSDFLDWVRENPEDYVMVVKNGHVIEKEPLYYAQVKGYKITNSSDTYWHVVNDLYVVLAGRNEIKNGENKLTLDEWNDFDITSENAEFVEVAE